jgi:hypothetical protein
VGLLQEVLETVGSYNIYGDGGNIKRRAIVQLHLQTTRGFSTEEAVFLGI